MKKIIKKLVELEVIPEVQGSVEDFLESWGRDAVKVHGIAENNGDPLFHWSIDNEETLDTFLERTEGKWKRFLVFFRSYKVASFDYI